MDRLDMAKIFAEQQAEPKETATTTTVTALATSDSVDGTVYVDMGGVTISGDDSQSVPIATTVAVKKGDTVRVELLGADGKAKTPTVTGVIGGGDRVQKAVDEAGETAQQASQTAEQAGEKAERAATDATDAKESADQAKQASGDAKKTADQAKEETKKMKNLIRETADGLALGKSADGETYETAYIELDASGAYKIKTKDGITLMELSGTSLKFNADKIKIGKTGGSLLSMGNSSNYIDDEHKTAVDAIIESPGVVGMLSNYVGHICAFMIGPDQNADFLVKRLIIHDPSDSDVEAQGSVADWSAALSAGQYMPHVKDEIKTIHTQMSEVADYITAQYFSPERSNWSWRKWASGFCEMWVIAGVDSTSGWSKVGNAEIWSYRDYFNLPIKLTALEDVQLTTDWDGWVTSSSEDPNLDSLGRVYFTLYQPTGSDGLDKSHTVRIYVRGRYK